MKYSEISDDIKKQLEREWIITNGIGGFASQSALGANTRKYHGLLIAPLTPPARRFMLLSKVDESIEVNGRKHNLYTNICNGYISEGFKYLTSIKKEYIPIYTYKVEDIIIKKFICMKYGENTVTVLYRITNKNENAKFTLAPILNFRDFHTVNQNHRFDLKQIHMGNKVKVTIDENSENPIYMNCTEGKYFKHIDDTFYNMYYPKEEERGFTAEENHVVPGVYNVNIYPNEEKDFTFVCSLKENIEEIDGIDVINKEVMRLSELVYDTGFINAKLPAEKRELVQSLVIATDNFLVNRPMFNLHTIIAGYPWFLDWGRDSLISFEGLLLLTRRYDMAREVLLTNIKDIKFGLIPNGYSGYDNRPLYNSADSSLLLFEQVRKYLQYTNDYKFIEQNIYPALLKIIDAYSHKIDVDGNDIYLDKDNLISAGTDDTQITWMDAKIGSYVVTPRNGKTVELNALWYNALRIMSDLTERFKGKENAKQYLEFAEKTKESFNKKFYNPAKKCLYDVLGDAKIRPNQLFALSLTYPVVDVTSEEAKNIIETVEEKLLNNYGLKTLAKEEKDYVEIYEGDSFKRDSSYHQGITWPWLLGLYYDSLKNILKGAKTKEDKQEYQNKLKKLIENTEETFSKEINERATMGSISEIYDSAQPYKARGAFAQAWSVAEVLRIIAEGLK